MDSDSCLGNLIIMVLVVAAIGAVLYLAVMLASVVATAAGVGGLAWGGGTAIVNYTKSIKENMIDSNRKAV